MTADDIKCTKDAFDALLEKLYGPEFKTNPLDHVNVMTVIAIYQANGIWELALQLAKEKP